MEQWLPVPGREGEYEVSDQGRIRSLDREVVQRRKGKILAPGRSSNGYPSVVMGQRDSRTVHAVVATAFLGPCPKGQQVRHKDGNRSNAALSNLTYGTPVENRADADRHQTSVRGSEYRTAKLTEKTARVVKALKGKVSQSKLAKRFKVSPAAIQAVHDGRTWKHA